MPELPEVEVVRRGLADVLVGRRITSVDIVGEHGPRALRRHAAGPADFAAALPGSTIIAVRRRGKYLWWATDAGDAVLAHLGMSGQFRVDLDETSAHRHTRLVFHLDDGRSVSFLDQRTFGGLQLVPGGADLPGPIAHIARDPLDPQFDRAAVVRTIRTKHSAIKRVLLDQSVISGIGNIYADEALWRARVHYDRPADTLSARAAGAVIDAATAVMTEALDAGGTSFDALYVNVNGESGYFDRTLQAYGQTGRPCSRCGTPIRREPFMNRSSFYCPHCQRPPRNRRQV